VNGRFVGRAAVNSFLYGRITSIVQEVPRNDRTYNATFVRRRMIQTIGARCLMTHALRNSAA
jgi:hypothetical protein